MVSLISSNNEIGSQSKGKSLQKHQSDPHEQKEQVDLNLQKVFQKTALLLQKVVVVVTFF